MNSRARAVYVDGPHQLRVAPAEPGAPGPGEALVRVAYAGICGSDRDLLAGTRPAAYVRYPVVPGHEWSGTVVAADDRLLVGKPVVGEGIRSCLRCASCRRGDNNLCEAEYQETGFTQPGAWADYLVLPARLLHELPVGTDLRSAAALEPAACAASACLRIAPLTGERIAVVGAGTLGLLAAQLLHAGHPSGLTVIDPRPDRVELAERCGATTVLTPQQAQSHAGRYDAVVEAAGAPGTARLAVSLARRGGRIALTGIAPQDGDPPAPASLVLGQLTVHTVFGAPSRAWSHAVRAFAAGALDPGLVVTHELPLEDVGEAFRLLADPASGAVKVLLRPGQVSKCP